MTAPEPGQAAYEAFRKAFPGEDWGPWDSPNVSDAESRDGWKSVAQAAVLAAREPQPARGLAEVRELLTAARRDRAEAAAECIAQREELDALRSGIAGLASELCATVARGGPFIAPGDIIAEIAEIAEALERLLDAP